MTDDHDKQRARARAIVDEVISGLDPIERASMVAGDRETIKRLRELVAEYEDPAVGQLLREEIDAAVREAQAVIKTPQDRVIHLMYWALVSLEANHDETVRILQQALKIAETMTGTRSGFDDADDPEDDLLYLCYARLFLRRGADLEGLADDIYWAGERAKERAQEVEEATP